jgi:pimeloyl-ACP methyl ester carboxylesterase
LWFREFGKGKPVLLLHSAFVSSRFWDFQVAHLSREGFRCITFDRRGHGRSDQPPEGYDYDTLADDVAAVIEALELRDLALVGHSMGCAEAIRYLTRHGSERIDRMALLGTVTPYLQHAADNLGGVPVAAAEEVRRCWRENFPQWVDDNIAPFLNPATSPGMTKWASQLVASASIPVALACNETVMGSDLRQELPAVTVPCLIMHGGADVSSPLSLTGERTAALIPKSRLKIYPDAPHGLVFTHMREVNEELTQFLDEAKAGRELPRLTAPVAHYA